MSRLLYTYSTVQYSTVQYIWPRNCRHTAIDHWIYSSWDGLGFLPRFSLYFGGTTVHFQNAQQWTGDGAAGADGHPVTALVVKESKGGSGE